MIYWMTNPDHGTMPVYSVGEKERTEKLGWALLNYGPSPDYASKAEKECKAALEESMRLDPPPVVDAALDAPIKRKPGRPAKAK